MKNVVLKYRPELPEVLKGLTMTVRPGEKIGIVGRTGAGKSSIMTALYRLVELTSGSIFIDGVDISQIGLSDLRRGLAIIPQDPVSLFLMLSSFLFFIHESCTIGRYCVCSPLDCLGAMEQGALMLCCCSFRNLKEQPGSFRTPRRRSTVGRPEAFVPR